MSLRWNSSSAQVAGHRPGRSRPGWRSHRRMTATINRISGTVSRAHTDHRRPAIQPLKYRLMFPTPILRLFHAWTKIPQNRRRLEARVLTPMNSIRVTRQAGTEATVQRQSMTSTGTKGNMPAFVAATDCLGQTASSMLVADGRVFIRSSRTQVSFKGPITVTA